jgi:methylglutaconyl-CoA hydratase
VAVSLVESTIADGVATITLGDEERRNALSRQLLGELMVAIDELERDPEVRVAVVTNRGHVFCAGANLNERSTAPAARRNVELSELFMRIKNSPKPFVGRIAGHCVAGGVGLAAVMDVSVALESAMFGFTEVRVGVAPAMISVVCLPKMRLGDAQAAFLRGNRFDAVEAARIGLINQAVAAEELDATVTAVVNDLLAGGHRRGQAPERRRADDAPRGGLRMDDGALARTVRERRGPRGDDRVPREAPGVVGAPRGWRRPRVGPSTPAGSCARTRPRPRGG